MEVFSYVLYMLLLSILYGALRYAWSGNNNNKNLPLGPAPLPVIGNLLSLGETAHRTLADLSRVHGPVMSLKLGCMTSVVISSAAAAKQVLQKHDLSFSDRVVADGALGSDHHLHSVVIIPISPKWRSLRRICKSHIFAAERLADKQDLRRRKVDDLLEYVRKCAASGLPVDIVQAAFNTALNLLSNTIFSMDLADPTSETAREFKALVSHIMTTAAEPNLSDFFPVMRHLDIQGIRRRLTGHIMRMNKIMDRLVDARVLARKGTDYRPLNDVLDVLLNICEENHEDGIDRVDMNYLLMDLFAAGTDTTSITLEWVMAELIHNPAIFSKVREEIHRVIGRDNPVQESDIAGLPYLEAVVKESFRMHPPTPFLIPRKAREDTEVMGFTVPKGAQVLVNAFAIGRDPESWEDPETFKPERFLGSEIDVKGKNFELIPFGAGRRICPGYPLAMRMLPLMVASLVQCFDWQPEGRVKPEDMDMEDAFGLTLPKARPLRAIATPI